MGRNRFSFPITTLAGGSVSNFLNICKKHRTEKKYYLKLTLSFLVSLIFEPFTRFERILWKRRVLHFRHEEPPVFIIGPWRSGTTLLHNLLCKDPAAGYTTTFHAVFPNVVLTQSWWLKPLANLIGPSHRPFDQVSMDMDYPQEEEFGLMNLHPSSAYKFFLFPDEFNQILESDFFTSSLSTQECETWRKKYREIAAKSLFNTGGRRYISKNPCNLGRLDILRELFPDARYIFIYRNPYPTLESLYRFIIEVFPGVQLRTVPADFSREDALLLYEKAIRSYLAHKEFIHPDNLIELRMEDFIANPLHHLENIYAKFRLGDFEKLQPVFQKYLENEGKNSSGSYKIDNESIKLVNQHMSDVLERFGYPMQ